MENKESSKRNTKKKNAEKKLALDGNEKFENFYMEFKNPLGRPLKYQPEELAELFAEYVEWCKDNPLTEEKVSQTFGSEGMCDTRIKCKHPRLVSTDAFLVYIGANKVWWSQIENGKKGDIFSNLKRSITEYCENYQKEMASAGFFKQNIISRLLGLADRKEVSATGNGMTVIVSNDKEKEKIEDIGNLGI